MCAIDDVSKSEEGPQEGHYEAPSHRIFFPKKGGGRKKKAKSIGKRFYPVRQPKFAPVARGPCDQVRSCVPRPRSFHFFSYEPFFHLPLSSTSRCALKAAITAQFLHLQAHMQHRGVNEALPIGRAMAGRRRHRQLAPPPSLFPSFSPAPSTTLVRAAIKCYKRLLFCWDH